MPVRLQLGHVAAAFALAAPRYLAAAFAFMVLR